MEKIVVPILLVGFNRPHCIRKVMQQLAIVQPENLYVSIDAPRKGKECETELVEKVKEIVKDVTWECNVRYRFFDKNVGAEVNVSSGIAWVLKEHECVIVNEDDIYAGYAFYKFIQDMLYHYKDDKRIGLVSGLNLTPDKDTVPDDYYISRSGHIWGWGTWRRVWNSYSLNEEIKEENLALQKLSHLYGSADIAINARKTLLRQSKKGVGKVTWDYMFWYHRIQMAYYAIVPNKSLITNIGVEGLHASGFSKYHFTKRCDDFKISKFHDFKWDKDYDIRNFKNDTKKSLIMRIIYRIIDKVKVLYLRNFKFTDEYLTNFYNS